LTGRSPARRAGPSIWLLLVFDGAAIGAIFPFLTVMLQSRGFDAFQIGLITALTSAAFTVALPSWGHIADAVLGRVRTLQVAALGAGFTLLVFLGPLPPIALAAVIVTFTVVEAPIAALADALVVNAVSDPARSYPRLRVLFSGAMAASTIVLGLILDQTGYVAVPIFYALAVAAMAHVIGEGSVVNAPPLLLPSRVALVMATLITIGIAAGLLPAARAARTDPAVSLRAT